MRPSEIRGPPQETEVQVVLKVEEPLCQMCSSSTMNGYNMCLILTGLLLVAAGFVATWYIITEVDDSASGENIRVLR